MLCCGADCVDVCVQPAYCARTISLSVPQEIGPENSDMLYLRLTEWCAAAALTVCMRARARNLHLAQCWDVMRFGVENVT